MRNILLLFTFCLAIIACEERDVIKVSGSYPANPQDTVSDTTSQDDPDPDPVVSCYLADSTFMKIEGEVVDAQFDTTFNRLAIATRYPNTLIITELSSRTTHIISLADEPTCLSILPLGTAIAVACRDHIYHYNLNTRVLRNTFDINYNCTDIVFTNFLWIYTVDHYRLRSIEVASKNSHTLANISDNPSGAQIFLSADQNTLYAPNHSDVKRYSIFQGSKAVLDQEYTPPNLDSPFWQNHRRNALISESGQVYGLNNNSPNDLNNLGTFNPLEDNILAYTENPAVDESYLITAIPSVGLPDTIISVMKPYNLNREIRLPKLLNENTCFTPQAEYIFFSPINNILAVITKAKANATSESFYALQRIRL